MAVRLRAKLEEMTSGKRVLITRAPHQSSTLAEQLRALGAEPILIPAIETIAPSSFTALDSALEHLGSFHWLLFTSANAVEAFAKRLNERSARVPQSSTASSSMTGVASAQAQSEPPSRMADSCDSSTVPKGRTGGTSRAETPVFPPMAASTAQSTLPATVKIAALGPSTARSLEKVALTPDLIPPKAVAESLTEALLPYARQSDGSPTRFLLIRAEEAREHLPETLCMAGAEVVVAPAYRTVVPAGSVESIRDLFCPTSGGVQELDGSHLPIDAITFTSSSTARNLLTLCEAAGVTLPETALRISIGPITSQTLGDLGLPPHAEAPEATVASLAETVLKGLSG